MNSRIKQISFWLGGVIALLGFNSSNSFANVNSELGIKSVTENSPLYLIHAQDIVEQNNLLAWHYSHQSHASHESHGSHASHYSHYSGRY